MYEIIIHFTDFGVFNLQTVVFKNGTIKFLYDKVGQNSYGLACGIKTLTRQHFSFFFFFFPEKKSRFIPIVS